jgi:ApbE superfamily uncharacterized protein (UPF0280 family)
MKVGKLLSSSWMMVELSMRIGKEKKKKDFVCGMAAKKGASASVGAASASREARADHPADFNPLPEV